MAKRCLICGELNATCGSGHPGPSVTVEEAIESMSETQTYAVPDGRGGVMSLKLTPEDAERLYGIGAPPAEQAPAKKRTAPNKRRTAAKVRNK